MANAWKGVNETINEIRKFGEDAIKKVDLETKGIAEQIVRNAKHLAPANFGDLQQTISFSKEKELTYKIAANQPYAAYVEFGTGKKFNAPAEWMDLAATFKGKTGQTFEQGVEAIKSWLHHKGGDEKDAEWILINLIVNGNRAQPFLYPAFVKGRIEYEKNLKDLLKRLNKKI